LVLDLHYNYMDNVLVAGFLGRGAWTLTNFLRGGGGTGFPPPTTAPTDLPDAPLNLPDVFPPMPSAPRMPMVP
jgi:hypothetical protein